MNVALKKNSIEKRIKRRKPYKGTIFFAQKNGFYEGRLKNYSQSGLFIETNAPLSIGDIIIIALPYVNDKQKKYRGQILWRNHKGFGIEFFKKRRVWGETTRVLA